MRPEAKNVAPITGAWIETLICAIIHPPDLAVAPITGAWIETLQLLSGWIIIDVAPITGAWIETLGRGGLRNNLFCRPHHGGVD